MSKTMISMLSVAVVIGLVEFPALVTLAYLIGHMTFAVVLSIFIIGILDTAIKVMGGLKSKSRLFSKRQC